MNQRDRFSERYGHSPRERKITVREDALSGVRAAVVQIVTEVGISPKTLREIVCQMLRVLPDRGNWSDSNVLGEVQRLVEECEWFQVYDIAEAIAQHLTQDAGQNEQEYQKRLNKYFRSAGVGWQFVDDYLETRGPEVFETTVRTASELLARVERPTASQEIHEALHDLSRRPTPDITGAMQHAMAALECVARDMSGIPKATLGEILKRKTDLLPKPIDEATEKLWGYASEHGRHLREGRPPERPEAELIVGLAASLATYLVTKHGGT